MWAPRRVADKCLAVGRRAARLGRGAGRSGVFVLRRGFPCLLPSSASLVLVACRRLLRRWWRLSSGRCWVPAPASPWAVPVVRTLRLCRLWFRPARLLVCVSSPCSAGTGSVRGLGRRSVWSWPLLVLVPLFPGWPVVLLPGTWWLGCGSVRPGRFGGPLGLVLAVVWWPSCLPGLPGRLVRGAPSGLRCAWACRWLSSRSVASLLPGCLRPGAVLLARCPGCRRRARVSGRVASGRWWVSPVLLPGRRPCPAGRGFFIGVTFMKA